MTVSIMKVCEEKEVVESASDMFFTISKEVNDLNGIEFLKKLLDILASKLNMQYGSVYEVVREGKYSLTKLVDCQLEANTFQINDLTNESLSFLMQEKCFITNKHNKHSIFDHNIKCLKNTESLVSVCISDADQKTIGLMVFGSNESVHVDDNTKEILGLFKSRVGAELERFRLCFSLEYARDQSRYISDLSRDMIWSIDTKGYYTYVNPACYDIYGYEAKDMIGRHYSDFINSSIVSEFDKLIEKNKKDDEVHKLITQHESASGYPVKLICTTKSLRDRNQELTGITGTSTDITEFIRSQLLFKSNNELFSKVLSRLPVIFFRVNEDAKIIDIRGRGLKRFGVGDMEWLDKSSHGLFLGKEDEINSVLKGGTSTFEIDGVVDDNHWAFFVSMFFDSWTGFGGIGFCVDITEQKLNEDKLEKLLNEKRELNQRLVKIQEEERRNLARELHDEFGQSITAVKSLAKAITAFSGDQYSETRSLSNSIVDLSGKLYEVVNDMMRRLRPEILDTLGLREAIKNCVGRSQLELEGVNCNIEFKGDLDSLDEVVTITIYRIIQECLTNISKYAMASNIDIEIVRDKVIDDDYEKRVRVYSSESDNKVLIRDMLKVIIKDDGIGMDVAKALKKKEHGNRMGLVGIEERLTALGGKLVIDSELYKGVKIEALIDISVSKASKQAADEHGG